MIRVNLKVKKSDDPELHEFLRNISNPRKRCEKLRQLFLMQLSGVTSINGNHTINNAYVHKSVPEVDSEPVSNELSEDNLKESIPEKVNDGIDDVIDLPPDGSLGGLLN